MGVLGEATVKIRADTANFHKDASRGVLSSIDSVGKDAESRAKKTFGAIGTAAKVAGAAGFIALGFAVKDVVSDFLEDDKAARQTAAVLKSTGGAANVTAGHVDRLATAIRNKTGIDDAAIAGGENMLLTFTKIHNEAGKGNAIFDQATKATANLSVAMGKDMTSSAMLVGKALNDPIKGMSALSRAGIQFTEQQKDTIKHMVKTGDTMGAQKIILKELETQFGGSADAAGKSLGGQLNILKGRLEDMGGVLVAKVMPYLLSFVSTINDNMPTIQRVVSDAFNAIEQAAGVARTAFDELRGVVETVLGFLEAHVGSLQQMAIALGTGAAAVVILTAAVKAYTAVQLVLNAVMSANPISLVIIAIAALVIGLTLLYQRSETARTIMNAVFNTLRTAATASLGFITDTLIPNAIAAWNRFGPGVVSALSTVASTVRRVIEDVAQVVETVVDAIEENWRGVWRTFGPLVEGYLNAVKTTVKTVLDIVAGFVRVFAALLRGDWEGAWNALKGIVSDALDGVVTVTQQLLTGLATTALRLAKAIADKIVAGIKTAPGKLVGLGGDLVKKIATAAGEAAKAAFNMGKRIADSIISGIGDIGARVAAKVSFGVLGQGGKVKSPGPFVKGGGGGGGGGGDSANLQTDAMIAGINLGPKLREKLRTEMANLFPPAIGTAMVQQLDKIFLGTTNAVNAGVAKMTAGMGKVREHLASSLDGLGGRFDEKLQPMIDKIASAPEKSREKLTTAARAVEKPMVDAFVKWVEAAKAAYDAKAANLIAAVDATFAKAQAKLDAWKAKLTPTEALLAQKQAEAAQAAVNNAVTAARASLSKLDADFNAGWAKLLADQERNMAKLKATQAVTETDEAIAGHEFSQTLAGASPLAVKALEARQALDTAKQLYAEHKISQDELFAAQDAYDAASLAAQDTTDASKLLQDYDTWQGLKKQTADGNAGIIGQEATDAEARAGFLGAYGEQRTTANQAIWDALSGQAMFALDLQAKQEREARDAMYETMSTQLKKRHDRIVTHLENVQHAHDLAFDKLVTEAQKSGGKVGEHLAKGMDDAQATVEKSAKGLAEVVKKFLKLNSPAEKGPLSDLDKWWTKLAPTLVSSLDGSSIKAALSDAVTPTSGGFAPSSARKQTLSLNDGALIGKVTELVDVLRKKDAPLGVTVLASGGAQAAVIAARR